MSEQDRRKIKERERKQRYDAKRAGTRTRNYTAVMYPEDLPDNWRDIMDDTHVRWVESPVHDKDVNADGSPKKIHIHVLIMWETVKSLEQVKQYFVDLFGTSDNGSIIGVATPQTVTDKCALVRYFAHLDNPSKAQYDVADIVGHNGADVAEILRYSQTETINMMIAIEEYIEEHDITELCDLARMIRYDHPEWYTIVATKCTVYYSSFVRSRRHKAYDDVDVDPETGEVMP